MHVFFLFLETIGTSEMLLIAFVALIVFGPRKLPELGRSLGRSLGEFKRASEDFKRTWEHEVEMERLDPGKRVEQEAKVPRSVSLPESNGATTDTTPVVSDVTHAPLPGERGETVARSSPDVAAISSAAPITSGPDNAEVPAPAGKQDWL